MHTKRKKYIVLLLLLIGLGMLVGYNRFFFDFKDVENATLFEGPISSQDGKYNASAYYISYGGAAGGILYLVEVEDTVSGKKKIIYSSEHKEIFSISWKAPDTLSIQNESPDYKEYRNAVLQVNAEIYEESGRACRSLRLLGQYERCYQAESRDETP